MRAFAEFLIMADTLTDIFEAGEEAFGLNAIIGGDIAA